MARSTRSTSPFSSALILLLSLTVLGGCGGDGGGTEPEEEQESIVGFWMTDQDNSTFYLHITSSAFTEYYVIDGEECAGIVYSATLTQAGEDRYTITNESLGFSATLVIVVENGNLRVYPADGSPQDGDLLTPADIAVGDLEECSFLGGADPSVDCSTLPAITLGTPINGELTTDDPLAYVFGGAYYVDLYQLQVDTDTQVTIGLESDDFDAWIALYQDDGTEVGFDDDGGEGFDSLLPADLTGGVCYVVEASTAFELETGTYVLTVNPAT